ncbi:hypothetical protein GBA52_025343 [Prunus armeniaca]|nr:hypothetical protein GBA52_025343 [Prunus armeniaca]
MSLTKLYNLSRTCLNTTTKPLLQLHKTTRSLPKTSSYFPTSSLQNCLHLKGADNLTTTNDNIPCPVFHLNVPIWMPNCQVTSPIPSTLENLMSWF